MSKIDLTKILKDCPEGTEFWSDNFGVVKFVRIGTEWDTPIEVKLSNGQVTYYTSEGQCDKSFLANCLLWPSKSCRDWSKFTASWQKKLKFDPKTLNEFDKVLVRDVVDEKWHCDFFSHLDGESLDYPYTTVTANWSFCIPYNDETKHLVGSKDEEPEFYRYYEEN